MQIVKRLFVVRGGSRSLTAEARAEDPLVRNTEPCPGVFQPPSSQSTFKGLVHRSEANLRLNECQPLPYFGSRPASLSLFLQQSRASERLTRLDGSLGAGSTGALPIPGFSLRA